MNPDNRKRFEAAGVEGVKARLISGHHYSGTWPEDAIAWLAEQGQIAQIEERERREIDEARARRIESFAKWSLIVATLGVLAAAVFWAFPRQSSERLPAEVKRDTTAQPGNHRAQAGERSDRHPK